MFLIPPKLGRARGTRRRSFTLVELVLNVIIIAMVAAIAVPRVSYAARTARGKSLVLTITRVRCAIERYYAEHGRYPGYDTGTGAPDDDAFVDQLTKYSDAQGNTNETLVYPYIYGPYLRPPFPTNPINDLNTVCVINSPGDAIALDSTGWFSVLSTGHFSANCSAERLAEVGVTDVGFALMEGAEPMAI